VGEYLGLGGNAELNKNVFNWRLKAYKLSQLRMSAGMLFQIKTDE